MALSSQTDWVTGPAPMNIGLEVSSRVPRSQLGIKLVVYSRLTSRYAFVLSESGNEPSSELVLDSTPIIPVDKLRLTSRNPLVIRIGVRFVTSATPGATPLGSPELALDCPPGACDGVYPIDAVVVDRRTDQPLASLTTHLVYLAGTAGLHRLDVSLVLPIGEQPSLGPAGNATVSTSQLQATGAIFGSLEQSGVRVTIDAYAQELVALQHSTNKAAPEVLSSLRLFDRQSPSKVEFLGTPFADVSETSLADAGLQHDFLRQLTTGHAAFRSALGKPPARNPLVSPAALDRGGLALLAEAKVRDVVVPMGNVKAISTTRTAPFLLAAGTGAPSSITGFAADPGLASHLSQRSDPVLAAHNFLSELAQVFFESPFATQPRGVVVAPSATISLPTLATVLGGLASSPITRSVTLSQLFADVPVGANAASRVERLVTPGPSHALTGGSVQSARSSLRALDSIIPTDAAVRSVAGESVLLGETYGLSGHQRADLFAAPDDAIAKVRKSLALAGTRTVTITQHSARVPFTIVSTFPSVVHALLHLASGELALAPKQTRLPVALVHKDTSLSVDVTARTSGVSTLGVELVSPAGGVVLLNDDFTVRSTAFSIVAVILSAAALAVLAAWWLRTVVRRRRRRAAEHADAAPSTPL